MAIDIVQASPEMPRVVNGAIQIATVRAIGERAVVIGDGVILETPDAKAIYFEHPGLRKRQEHPNSAN